MNSSSSSSRPSRIIDKVSQVKKSIANKFKKTATLQNSDESDVKTELTNVKTDHTIILLGAGEVGKSTLFKQFQLIYDNSRDPIIWNKELKSFAPIISYNIKDCAKTLQIQRSKLFPEKPPLADLSISARIQEIDPEVPLSPQEAEHIDMFLREELTQKVFQKRGTFCLPVNAKEFLPRVIDIANPNYQVTKQDMLAAYVRTTGISFCAFEKDSHTYHVKDTGGQRNERQKWINLFIDDSQLDVVIFVANMASYNQVLYECKEDNRFTEDLNLFEEIINARWFANTMMVLMLNFVDELEEKMLKMGPTKNELDAALADTLPLIKPLQAIVASYLYFCDEDVQLYRFETYFPDSANALERTPLPDYIEGLFRQQDHRSNPKELLKVYRTTMVDTPSIQKILDDILDSHQKSLRH